MSNETYEEPSQITNIDLLPPQETSERNVCASMASSLHVLHLSGSGLLVRLPGGGTQMTMT
jgi:hypothetical protein